MRLVLVLMWQFCAAVKMRQNFCVTRRLISWHSYVTERSRKWTNYWALCVFADFASTAFANKCSDRVASVRDEAASLLARVLSKFVRYEWRGQSAHVEIKTIPVTASFANDTIKGFARSKNWRRRQTFVLFLSFTISPRLRTLFENRCCTGYILSGVTEENSYLLNRLCLRNLWYIHYRSP